MKKQNKTILIYEIRPEIELIFKDYFANSGYTLRSFTNIKQVNFLAEQLNPLLIIINSPNLADFKPSNKVANTPLLLPKSEIEVKIESCQKITFFKKPIKNTDFQKLIQRIIENIFSSKDFSDDFDKKWIETKLNNGYNFHYTGSINQDEFHRIFERIEELIAVGRDHFTLNLTATLHIENITPSSFHKLHAVATKSKCYLKIIMNASELAEALSHEGIDIDQYIGKVNY